MLPLNQIFTLSVVSGLFGLDATAALQVMVSRPLVVGGVVGWMLGEPALGLAMGSLVELLWIGGVPVGAVVPPDGTQAATFATVVAVRLGHANPAPQCGDAAAALGMVTAVAVGVLGARAEVMQRRLMGHLGRRADRAAERGDLGGLRGVMAMALGLVWLRGALVCAFSLALGIPALELLMVHLPPEAIRALHWCFWLFWLLGLVAVADHFWERRALKFAGVAMLGTAVLGSSTFGLEQGGLLALALVAPHAAGIWRWLRALRGEGA